jgi:hypothetical protein
LNFKTWTPLMTTLLALHSLPAFARQARLVIAAAAAGLMAACVSAPAPIYAPDPSAPVAPIGPRVPPSALPSPGALFGAPEILPVARPLQCVPYARDRSGVQIYGDAFTWWDQAEGRFARVNQPRPGAVMAMLGYQTTTRGHVAFVTAVLSGRMILVDHANWLNGGEISINVPILDVSPGNDWSQVRVWHIPGSHWGGRVYNVQGFILPDLVTVARS